jgi:integrase
MAEQIILAHQASSTKKAYEKYVKDYNEHRGELPNSEAVILSFLTKESATKAPTTLWTIYSLVKKYLLLECSFDLGHAERVNEFLKTLMRQHKKKKAAAFSREDIFKFLRAAPSEGEDLVCKLVLLAGFYGGLRGCELVALTWQDLTFSKEGILLRIAFSKTDRAGVGVVKLMPKIEEDAICPVYYFTMYKNMVGVTTGRLFCYYRHGKFTKAPLGKNQISAIPRTIATFLGLENPNSYTGHALRVSSATVLADEGANSLALKRHGRWASDSIAEGYLRESKQVRSETAGYLAGQKISFIEKNDDSHKKTLDSAFSLSNCVFNGPVIFQETNTNSLQKE